jgi:CubicO group peptidase (beta-lactamase class C family)
LSAGDTHPDNEQDRPMHATTTSTNAPPSASHLPAPLDDLLADVVADGRIPGVSLAVTTSTTLLYAGGSGWADLDRRRRASAQTPYLWFSLTKIATATAAMALADRGRLDLGAPISDYLPSYPTSRRSAPPAVRQLLDHTAGLPNPIPVRWIRPAGRPAPDPATFLARLLAEHGTVKHPVGGPARYSNLGYLVLAEVIAAAAGESFTDVLRDVVLTPAGMAATGFAHRGGTATGYVRAPRIVDIALKAYLPAGTVGPRRGRQLAFEPFLVNGPGYGGLVGDVIDAARLARLHLADGTIDGHRVLAPDTARRMRTISSPGRPVDLGLGWYRQHDSAAAPGHVEHIGAGGGYRNVMRIYPDLDLGLVVMANATTRYDHGALFDRITTIAGRR